MLILEIIAQFLIEQIFINLICGGISRIYNFILKLRGIETRSQDEIKLERLKRRYEYKSVRILKDVNKTNQKGSNGVVRKLIDKNTALVELKNNQDPIEIKLKYLLVRTNEKKNKS